MDRRDRVVSGGLVDRPPAHASLVRLGRAVAVHVDADVNGGQPALGTGELEPRRHLHFRPVAPQLDAGVTRPRLRDELVDPLGQLSQGALERVETLALD